MASVDGAHACLFRQHGQDTSSSGSLGHMFELTRLHRAAAALEPFGGLRYLFVDLNDTGVQLETREEESRVNRVGVDKLDIGHASRLSSPWVHQHGDPTHFAARLEARMQIVDRGFSGEVRYNDRVRLCLLVLELGHLALETVQFLVQVRHVVDAGRGVVGDGGRDVPGRQDGTGRSATEVDAPLPFDLA